ncbi:MAG: class I SAM-dependent methyltransferase [Cyanobacteria bacterium J06621_8]
MESQNQSLYRSSAIVNYYQYLTQLQPAEKTILEKLQPQLSEFKMLDIGVGGGKTTTHYAPLVKEYYGIDYSPEMIAACQAKFSSTLPQDNFQVLDARDLSQFADNSFDFILFSFNGIDSVKNSDRQKIFSEVARIGKPDAYFAFSTHNLYAMIRAFRLQTHLRWNPITTYINLFVWVVLRFTNLSKTIKKLKNSDFCIVRDESHDFRLQNFYIKPEVQLEQLAAYFQDIELYSWKSGNKIESMEDAAIDSNFWLYYLCRVIK